jgi:hypothetical protein
MIPPSINGESDVAEGISRAAPRKCLLTICDNLPLTVTRTFCAQTMTQNLELDLAHFIALADADLSRELPNASEDLLLTFDRVRIRQSQLALLDFIGAAPSAGPPNPRLLALNEKVERLIEARANAIRARLLAERPFSDTRVRGLVEKARGFRKRVESGDQEEREAVEREAKEAADSLEEINRRLRVGEEGLRAEVGEIRAKVEVRAAALERMSGRIGVPEREPGETLRQWAARICASEARGRGC